MSSVLLTKTRSVLTTALLAAIIGVSVSSAAYAVTSIGTDVSTDGSLSAHGNVNFNDASADTLLIGQNGGTPDTVTIAGNLSLTDGQWNVSATGAATFVSVSGDGSALTGLDAGDVSAGTLGDARLSSAVAHLDAAETISGDWENTANPWSDAEVSDTLTISASSTIDPAALPAFPSLSANETISGNWVNTANPWADNEVANNLTVSGGTIDGTVIGGTTRAAGSFSSLSVGTSGAAISRHLSASASNVTSASISAASCGNYATVSVTDAAVGDTVVASPSPATNGIEDVNLSWSAFVSSSGTVTIRACNTQALSAINTDDSQTWRIDVWQH